MTSPTVTSKNGDNSPTNVNASPPMRGNLPDPTQENASIKIEAPPPKISQPLAPPPLPAPARSTAGTGDYFGTQHNSLTTELNPFEHQFGGGPVTAGDNRTPGGTKLPSVAALASPAGPFFGSSTPGGFFASLRSGPLSPAMLSAPKAQEDYFSEQHSMRSGFTPNESGLRSGLTPGGGGSMFPEPSPGTSAMFQSIQSGGMTPASLDFQRTAMNIANKLPQRESVVPQNITSQPQEMANGNRNEAKPFGHPDDTEAANGLFMLSQNQSRQPAPQPPAANHYTLAPQQIAPQLPIQHSHTQPQAIQMSGQQVNGSPHMNQRNNPGSTSTASGRGASVVSNGFSDDNTQPKPNTRGKKRTQAQANGQGKGKAANNKKAKANGGHGRNHSMDMDSLQEPESPEPIQEMDGKDEYNAQGKKLTDEEKRKNFLERNRIAALKCRQRKKQWLANLQSKVEMYSTENEALNQALAAAKMDIISLRAINDANRGCPLAHQHAAVPVSQTQGGPLMNGYDDHQMNAQNPYGMQQPEQHHPQAMQ